MAKDLTARAIEALKPGPSRREIADGHTRGLYLVIQPSGLKSWVYRYRHGGAPKKLTIGPWPALTLTAARNAATEAIAAVASGANPAARKQSDRQMAKEAAQAAKEPARDLIETVVSNFIARHAKKLNKERTARETELLLKREIVGPWAGRKLGEITRADVRVRLEIITDRGAPIRANRLLAAFRKLCNWAISQDLIEKSPCERLEMPNKETSRDRVLTDEEIKMAWGAFDRIGWPFGPMGKLLLLTGQRLNEVAKASWNEIDATKRVWTIPAARAKNADAHEVQLSDQTLAILASLPRRAVVKGAPPFVFSTNGKTAISGFSRAKVTADAHMAEAMASQAQARGVAAKDVEALPHWTWHDLRRTCASGMAGLGTAPHVVDKILNHKSGSIKGVARVYNRQVYSKERQAALEAWGRYVNAVVNRSPAGNVVELAMKRG